MIEGMDRDGYGYAPGETGIDRLLADFRTLSPLGVARAAGGWDKHVEPDHTRFHEAERTALRALENADRAPGWEDLRRSLFELTEGRVAMVAWQAEHGDIGHKAEQAAYGAALAIFSNDLIDRKTYTTLVGSMAEALPWLMTSPPAGVAES
jgi:hypothetical protein